ncbi:MAG TPA: DUF4178 domain-containing protein [Planctomycetota bacterium]|jgi:hypothetical protein
MAVTRTNCPSCGAPITFAIGSSIVVICPNCRSAVARTDRNIENLGKVADLVETNSPLAVGLTGKYSGHSFQLTGRAQMKHAAGGVWDEWYAAFDDGRWGWLAEAQGRFFLTFEMPLHGPAPSYAELELGKAPQSVTAGLIVAEMGTATYGAAEGEIPYRLEPEREYEYADLSGPSGEFATLDFGELPPSYYLGRELTLDKLGLGPVPGPEREKRVGSERLGCPNCGGSLELHAPDQAERVGCPYCGSLLDCTKGALKLLSVLKTKKHDPLIKLGSVGEFEGVKQIVIGFVVRSCVVDGTKYFWREYLLYSVKLGFRWLVESDAQWTYVQAVSPGLVKIAARDVIFRNERYKRFQDANAVVEYVVGEFYWKVQVGETVEATDFICPPYMLSRETTRGQKGQPQAGEINWSLGEYVSYKDIQAKFKLATIRAPSIVGACQPFPHKGMAKLWGFFAAVAIVLILLDQLTASNTLVFNKCFLMQITPPAQPTPAAAQPAQVSENPQPAAPASGGAVMFSEPFELTGGKNVYIEAASPVDNSWAYVTGDLINEETGDVQPFEMPLEYYHGYDDGNWSEGSPNDGAFISALPAGKYILRLEAEWEKRTAPLAVDIKIHQGVARWLNGFLLLLALSVIPLLVGIWKFSFERRRWSESMYNPYASSDD